MAVPVHPPTQPQVAAGPLRAAASFNPSLVRTRLNGASHSSQSLGRMTTPTPFSFPAVALRVFGISILCALLFLLDRIIPPLLGLEYSRIQSATLYLWLIVLPLVGYSWILLRSE